MDYRDVSRTNNDQKIGCNKKKYGKKPRTQNPIRCEKKEEEVFEESDVILFKGKRKLVLGLIFLVSALFVVIFISHFGLKISD
jgi:hypothetical protein